MTRDEFLIVAGRLYDQVVQGVDPDGGHLDSFVVDCAVGLQHKLDHRAYPFDIDIVAIKDILNNTDCADYTPKHIGQALSYMGAVKVGQVMDGAGTKTRVWAVKNANKYLAMKPSEIEQIFQRNQ